jgi:hypothetical protein
MNPVLFDIFLGRGKMIAQPIALDRRRQGVYQADKGQEDQKDPENKGKFILPWHALHLNLCPFIPDPINERTNQKPQA